MTSTDKDAVAHALENTQRHVSLSGPRGWAYWIGDEWVVVRRNEDRSIEEICRTEDVERAIQEIDPQ